MTPPANTTSCSGPVREEASASGHCAGVLSAAFLLLLAGLALVASYIVVVALMYVFTQRLFPVPYEWGRLAKVLLVSATLVAVGELALPTEGFAGLLGRSAVWALFPFALLGSGFFSPEELRRLALLRHPGRLLERLREASRRPATIDGEIPEAYEAVRIDEDARNQS